jgi:hypothetical protein
MVKSLLVGLLCAVAGGLLGLVVYAILVWSGSSDTPRGGMEVFTLVTVPAVAIGSAGFSSTFLRLRRREPKPN